MSRRLAKVCCARSSGAEDRAITIRRLVSLTDRNTLALPARAAAYAEPTTPGELQDALAWARAEGVPVTPLGEGSNVVLAGDLAGLVVRPLLRGVTTLAQDDVTITLRVAAGENWHAFVERCLRAGHYGLENLAFIPGTVGAAPIQNIGAYGVELESFLSAVHAIDIASGEAQTYSAADCAFGYRESVFKQSLRDSVVITAVDLKLPLQPRINTSYPALAEYLVAERIASPTAAEVFAAVVAIRSARLPDPADIPNAGSFFKNPVVDASRAAYLQAQHSNMPVYDAGGGYKKLSAAWLIDQCGWRGHGDDGVGVHEDHALVLVNRGGGTGARLLAFAARIQQSVLATFGVALEIEPRIYGAAS